MHTEHLQNVRPGTVAFGWFISVALTSLAVIAMIAVGLLSRDGTGGGTWPGVLALAAGFFAGGYYVGVRRGQAPILYAVAMGLFSLVVWFVLNLVPGELLDAESWSADSSAYTAGVLLLQIAAAAVGGLLGSRNARAVAEPNS